MGMRDIGRNDDMSVNVSGEENGAEKTIVVQV